VNTVIEKWRAQRDSAEKTSEIRSGGSVAQFEDKGAVISYIFVLVIDCYWSNFL
jgi:hypothetical protein